MNGMVGHRGGLRSSISTHGTHGQSPTTYGLANPGRVGSQATSPEMTRNLYSNLKNLFLMLAWTTLYDCIDF